MTFQMVLAAEPHYYHCTQCGKELIIRGRIELTEKLRKRGVCDACLTKMHRALSRSKPVIFLNVPWAKAGLN